MKLTVKYLDKKRFEVKCRSHRVITDQPESENGTNQGMTPVELFNASLASCVAYYAMMFLKRRIPDLTLQVQSGWQYSDDPHRIGDINLTIVLPHSLTDQEKRGVLRCVEHCTIENTLKHTPNIQISVREEKG